MPAAKTNQRRSSTGTAGAVKAASARRVTHIRGENCVTASREKSTLRATPCKKAAAPSAAGKKECSASITRIKVRSLLCHNCNRGLGLFGDSIEKLSKAIDYLRRHEMSGL
jgi:hypothetical protein